VVDLSPFSAVDLILLGLLALFALGGYRRGFIHETIDLVGLGLAIALAIVLNERVGAMIARVTDLPSNLVGLIAFAGVFFVALGVLGVLGSVVAWSIEKSLFRHNLDRLNALFGVFPAVLKGALIVGFGLRALTLLPLGGVTIDRLADSAVAGWIADSAALTLPYFEEAFDQVAEETTRFVPPFVPGAAPTDGAGGSSLSIPRGVTTWPDPDAEAVMLRLINQERAVAGRAALSADNALRDVARAHSEEMFRLGYFAHESPTTGTPFDRLRRAGLRYLAAGENLAYAPTVEAAHRGLMESDEHRRNILTPEFRRVGIGVQQAGLWGRMFTQVFAG
jgi:uncharacterized protein YkwD